MSINRTWILGLVTGVLLLMPVVSQAVPIDFTLENATATFASGATVAISGSFTFDVAKTTQSNVSLTVTGHPAFNGTYTAKNPINTSFTSVVIAKEPVSADIINLTFSAPLDGIKNPDPLTIVEFLTSVGTFKSASTTGSAKVVAEPPELAIFVTAIGLWLFTLRGRVLTGFLRHRAAEAQVLQS